jgi:hypothetical protein
VFQATHVHLGPLRRARHAHVTPESVRVCGPNQLIKPSIRIWQYTRQIGAPPLVDSPADCPNTVAGAAPNSPPAPKISHSISWTFTQLWSTISAMGLAEWIAIAPRGIYMADPIKWLEWTYGKWFLGHPWRGFFSILGACGIVLSLVLGVLWLKALDQYAAENPASPKPQTVTANDSAPHGATVRGSSTQGVQEATSPNAAQKKATSVKAKKPAQLQQNAEADTPQPIPSAVPGVRNLTDIGNTYRQGAVPDIRNTHQSVFENDLILGPPPQTTTTIKIVNSFIEGGAIKIKAEGCEDGKTSTRQPCGTRNVEDRLNVYFNTEGNGIPNTHQQLAEDNQYLATRPGKMLTIAGEDTTFRHNTVRNMDVAVSPEAQRAAIYDNLFEADSLVAQVARDNEQLESALADIRSAYEERWKSLPDATYRANEELLVQFEKRARQKPLDRGKMRTLLQEVIDATPRQP